DAPYAQPHSGDHRLFFIDELDIRGSKARRNGDGEVGFRSVRPPPMVATPTTDRGRDLQDATDLFRQQYQQIAKIDDFLQRRAKQVVMKRHYLALTRVCWRSLAEVVDISPSTSSARRIVVKHTHRPNPTGQKSVTQPRD